MSGKERPVVGALFAGRVDDGGFMEYGYRGLMRASGEFALATTHIDGVPPQADELAAALRRLAGTGARLVIAHGGQNDSAALEVATENPKICFVVTQGSVRGENLASYEVRQEQSAFLAGVAAARLTRTRTVGHISGIRVRPGLLGRSAFAAGVAAVDSGIRLLTTFCGTQDESAVAARVATAQITAGADIIFTMLNAAIPGAIAACQAQGIRLIGNVRDWVAVEPSVFAGSAIADVGIGVYEACREHARGDWRPGHIRHIGVENPAAVRLALAPDLPQAVPAMVAEWNARLVRGDVKIADTYSGPEFEA